MNSSKDEVLPFFIPEEAEKIVNQTPVWKIKLCKEALPYMVTDEDTGAGGQFWVGKPHIPYHSYRDYKQSTRRSRSCASVDKKYKK